MSKLLKSVAHTVKAALHVEEQAAQAAGDSERLAELLDLHQGLADLLVQFAGTLGFTDDEVDGMVHTDGGGTPK